MQLIIEKIDNGFLVIYQDQKGRVVTAFATGADVLAFLKRFVDPSPIVTPDPNLSVVK